MLSNIYWHYKKCGRHYGFSESLAPKRITVSCFEKNIDFKWNNKVIRNMQ